MMSPSLYTVVTLGMFECALIVLVLWCFISGVYAAAAQDPFALTAAAAAASGSGMQVKSSLRSQHFLLS